jgi:hypothetical protein
MSPRRSAILLGVLLVCAAALRLYRVGDEEWLDEILTHVLVSRLDLAELATSYPSQNQHVLYSLLARVSIVALGDSTAALRVPAVVFGVLGIAATYVLGRELLSRREALAAAALLTVSDVHVWFSQNARGYTALQFFTVLASILLLRALASDRRTTWAAWGVTLALGAWVHLTMLFVVTGHALLVLRRRLPGPTRTAALVARLRGPLLGLAVTAVVTAAVYAPMLGDLLAVTAVEGRSGSVPQWSSTGWAVRETAARLLASFPRPGLALGALICCVAGVVSVAHRAPVLLELLLLPVVVGLVVVAGSGHHVWPRFFSFAGGLATLVTAAGAAALGTALVRRVTHDPAQFGRAATVAVTALVGAVALGLHGAYGPKQRYAEAVALVQRDGRTDDAFTTAGPAAPVFRDAWQLPWTRVGTAEELDRVRAGAARTGLVHSFPVHLRSARAGVAQALDRDFELIARFDGTLRGGETLVWRTRDPQPVASRSPRG